jgi:D-glycero-alpha-D-manno-heptose-7-phosphate kinase
MLIVRSPVRISFGGGGTDLPTYYEKYGGAVLSTSINKYFYTILTRRNDGKVQIISSDLRAIDTSADILRIPVKGKELEIPLAVLAEIGCDVSVDLFLASEIPPGTGLGSSASVCVNVLKALTTYLRLAYSNYELAEKAYHIARHVLGKPVGKQDEYAAVFGGLNYITFHSDGSVAVEPVALAPEVDRELQQNLMLFFTGAAHNSWAILEEQEHSMRSSSGLAVESLRYIHELASRMRKCVEEGDLDGFGALLDEGWQAKNSRIDRYYEIARANGALGGKITGAGGGGFLLLYCEKQRQDAVRVALDAEGVRELTFEFDTMGARVLVNDPFLDSDSRCGLRWSFTPGLGTALPSPR